MPEYVNPWCVYMDTWVRARTSFKTTPMDLVKQPMEYMDCWKTLSQIGMALKGSFDSSNKDHFVPEQGRFHQHHLLGFFLL